MDKKNKYVDNEGKEYKLGDLVLNPFFNDMWIVQEWEGNYGEGEECPYCFAQYGFQDLYCMAVDEPIGFIIVGSVGDNNYEEVKKQIMDIGLDILKSEEEDEVSETN